MSSWYRAALWCFAVAIVWFGVAMTVAIATSFEASPSWLAPSFGLATLGVALGMIGFAREDRR